MVNRKNYNQDGKERSAFGDLLHKEFLDRQKPKITHKKLAETIGQKEIDETVISRIVVHGEFGNDQTAYNRFYAIFTALAKLCITISEDQAQRLLISVKDTYLSDQLKKDLIARLKKELIIKQTYKTRQGSPLLGRERVIQEIVTMLQELHKDGIRLLTLVGLHGVGKTELAWQIKEMAQKQNIQVRFLYLESLTLAHTVLDKIKNVLKDIDIQKQTLLILDNCEQIKGIECIEVLRELAQLLSDRSQLTILATSRAEFSDKSYEVLPLKVPTSIFEPLDQLKTYDAIELFMQRANASRNREELKLNTQTARMVADLCIALDGLPLGIEIVASRVKALPIETVHKQLLNRKIQELEKRPLFHERHLSLRTAIAWSYDLLSDQQKRLFRRLAVFERGCKYAVAPIVCNIEGDLNAEDIEIMNLAEELRNWNLITVSETRMGIIPNTLREYASIKLDATGETEILIRQKRDFYLGILEKYMRAKYLEAKERLIPQEFTSSEVEKILSFFSKRVKKEEMQKFISREIRKNGLQYFVINRDYFEIAYKEWALHEGPWKIFRDFFDLCIGDEVYLNDAFFNLPENDDRKALWHLFNETLDIKFKEVYEPNHFVLTLDRASVEFPYLGWIVVTGFETDEKPVPFEEKVRQVFEQLDRGRQGK